ncbi:Uncharacterized protein ChrSV_4390 [Chromobacterium vaccinii]|nr:Uncharacterized protein ChrSW_4390 [Chromobacterium vaccinii]QND91846.1 Uncharacterized protein ChrSV_4390 [Chromobacterium vaccinii]
MWYLDIKNSFSFQQAYKFVDGIAQLRLTITTCATKDNGILPRFPYYKNDK